MPQKLVLNPLEDWDSYKPTQAEMLRPGVTEMYDYYSARGGEYPYQVLFGLQFIIKSKLEGQYFTKADLDEAVENSQSHFYKGFPFPKEMFEHILKVHGGRLPIEIKAVREGIPVPTGNIMFSIRNTDPACAILPGLLETLLQHTWYGSTVCTKSREIKVIIKEFLQDTADNLDTLNFQLHDFGMRAVSSSEQAAIGGAAHLINFLGTDTQPANALLRQFYGADRVSGYSVPASEHSVTTVFERDHEADFVEYSLSKYPKGILSLVADSYDVYNFAANIIGGKFRAAIKARDGKIVIRPDSGNPNTVVIKLLEILADKFGFETNKKGYRILPPCIGIIWGDGMDEFSIRRLFQHLKDNGWSASNIVVGMGGGLLQKLNRDTQKVAIKCSAAIVNGKVIDVYKDPITDPGKTSLRGKLALVDNEGDLVTIKQSDVIFPLKDMLETVFLNGEIKRDQSLAEIRKLAEV